MDEDDLDTGATLVMGPLTPALINSVINGVRDLFSLPRPHSLTQEQVQQAFDRGNLPAPPNGPPGSGALPDAASGANDRYRDMSGAAAATDAKVAELLGKYLASNESLRSQVFERINDLQRLRDQLMQHPEYLAQPDQMKAIGGHFNDTLGQIQALLAQAKLNNAQQAELLGLLAEEYRVTAAGSGGRPGK